MSTLELNLNQAAYNTPRSSHCAPHFDQVPFKPLLSELLICCNASGAMRVVQCDYIWQSRAYMRLSRARRPTQGKQWTPEVDRIKFRQQLTVVTQHQSRETVGCRLIDNKNEARHPSNTSRWGVNISNERCRRRR
jgi:hypothetical protein